MSLESLLETPLKDQRIQIQLNSATGALPVAALPYDPANAPDASGVITIIAPNYLDNTDFDFSKNAYVASGAGDADYECYNWYRQRFIKVTDVVTTATSNAITSASNPFHASFTYPMSFVLLNGSSTGAAIAGYINRTSDSGANLFTDAGMGTPLNVDNTLTDAVLWFGTPLAETSANALKATGHSLFAANEGTLGIIPRWDRTNGWGEIGSNVAGDSWDIATPLPLNFIRAGVTYYFRLIISQRTGATPGDPVRVSLGIFDGTTSQTRFLESGNLTLAVVPVGTTGATTYKYRIIADLDDGTAVQSNEVTTANGNASLSTSHYNRLTWTNAPNILNYRIYREVGGVVKRIFTIRNGAQDYNDYGTDEGETPGAMPGTGVVRPIAYKVSGEFDVSGEGVWQTVLMKIEVPPTYDSSATTGKQWLRWGIEGTAGDERLILFDRAMLSTSDGGWQRSSRDLTLIQSQTPTSTPPDSGGQGSVAPDNCFTLDTLVVVCDEDGANLRQIPIGDINAGDFVFSGARKVFKVKKVKQSTASEIIDIGFENDVSIECTPSEKFVTSRADKNGTRADDLCLGDEVLSWQNGVVNKTRITSYGIKHVTTEVRTLSLKGGHNFIVTNGEMTGVIVHNDKQIVQ